MTVDPIPDGWQEKDWRQLAAAANGIHELSGKMLARMEGGDLDRHSAEIILAALAGAQDKAYWAAMGLAR
jgi:hypothetical protein